MVRKRPIETIIATALKHHARRGMADDYPITAAMPVSLCSLPSTRVIKQPVVADTSASLGNSVLTDS